MTLVLLDTPAKRSRQTSYPRPGGEREVGALRHAAKQCLDFSALLVSFSSVPGQPTT
ncbi:hypothetical protein [Streptomyces sp. NPDC001665]